MGVKDTSLVCLFISVLTSLLMPCLVQCAVWKLSRIRCGHLSPQPPPRPASPHHSTSAPRLPSAPRIPSPPSLPRVSPRLRPTTTRGWMHRSNTFRLNPSLRIQLCDYLTFSYTLKKSHFADYSALHTVKMQQRGSDTYSLMWATSSSLAQSSLQITTWFCEG